MMNKVNLLNFSKKTLENYFTDLGEEKFRAHQIMRWIYREGVFNFDAMTNLSKKLREKLNTHCEVKLPNIQLDTTSVDGTRKWLFNFNDKNSIETVFIPEENRGTLCVSSQIGCSLNCQFCATARMGFNRNLSIAEIIGQVVLARQLLLKANANASITNIVMMGMGEPLLNYDNVVASMSLMMDDLAFGLSKYRVTLSTSGVVPAMYQLAKDTNAALAVSLHAPNDFLRTQIVPINKKYPIAELMAACKNYFAKEPKRSVTFEYVMLKDVNDQPTHAKQLVKVLKGVPAKVNLIPFNPFDGSGFSCSSEETISQFRAILSDKGIVTTTRKTRGADIAAACGQLKGSFIDKTRGQRRFTEAVKIA